MLAYIGLFEKVFFQDAPLWMHRLPDHATWQTSWFQEWAGPMKQWCDIQRQYSEHMVSI